MKYAKTETGHQALHDRSVALTSRQRSAFILLDGKRSTADVLKATAAMGVTREDVEYMLHLGLIEAVADESAALAATAAAVLPEPVPAAAPADGEAESGVSSQERYQRAYPIAIRLTSSLGLRGFRLNLAVEAAANLEQLQDLAPKIREAVGSEKFEPLGYALYG